MWAFAALLLGGMVAAAVLHEATHAAAVVAVGGKVRQVSLRTLDVYWALDDGEPLWKDRVIGLAPMVLGLAVAVGALAVGMVPEGRTGIILAASWAIYTLFGGVEDYKTGVAA